VPCVYIFNLKFSFSVNKFIGQTVKDDFAMAKNTLNQSGHPGAFLNFIHRKADAEDSILILPLVSSNFS
jgi:hypothetical protein